jgi:hypothetical protein
MKQEVVRTGMLENNKTSAKSCWRKPSFVVVDLELSAGSQDTGGDPGDNTKGS